MNILPKEFPQFEESVYAGFGRRLGAILLDILITLPFLMGIGYVQGMSQTLYTAGLVVVFIFIFFYYIYAVKAYGASPGKHIAGIKIVKLDGTDVTWNEAILRSLVDICLMAFGFTIGYLSVMSMSADEYESLTFMTRGPRMQEYSPEMFMVQGILGFVWPFSEPIVLLFNKRRRALHDFIGETLVIKAKYQKQILEIAAQSPNENAH